jgi:hypothetical protein
MVGISHTICNTPYIDASSRAYVNAYKAAAPLDISAYISVFLSTYISACACTEAS